MLLPPKQVSAIAEELLKTEYDAVRIIYNRFYSAISLKPTIATVLRCVCGAGLDFFGEPLMSTLLVLCMSRGVPQVSFLALPQVSACMPHKTTLVCCMLSLLTGAVDAGTDEGGFNT